MKKSGINHYRKEANEIRGSNTGGGKAARIPCNEREKEKEKTTEKEEKRKEKKQGRERRVGVGLYLILMIKPYCSFQQVLFRCLSAWDSSLF